MLDVTATGKAYQRRSLKINRDDLPQLASQKVQNSSPAQSHPLLVKGTSTQIFVKCLTSGLHISSNVLILGQGSHERVQMV